MATAEELDAQARVLQVTQGITLVVILGVLLLIMFGTIAYSGGEFLLKLKDIDTARGLITFVVAAGVVSIAAVIAVYVMASTNRMEEIKDRFGYAKDIFAALVGIFGTVLGFYYASQNQASEPIAADFQIRSDQLIGHISGSAQPYHYTIAFPNDDRKTLQQRVAKDGWIVETIPSSMTKGAIQIEITDAKERKLSKSIQYAPEEKTSVRPTEALPTAPSELPPQKPVEKPLPSPPVPSTQTTPGVSPKNT